MADQRREPDQRPSPEALLDEATTRREPRRPAEDLPRRGARRRQDLRDAAGGPRQAEGRRRRRRRRGRDARPQGDRGAARRPRGHSAPAPSSTRTARSRRWTSTRILARRPQLGAGRRARPHQCRRQPPSQALSRRRGAAEQRHRRLHDGQHPAHREPERRRGADHRACACARPCRTRSSTAPTPSSWSTSRPTT